MPQNLLHAFVENVRTQGDRLALISAENGEIIRLTWLELANRVIFCADLLEELAGHGQISPVGYSSTNTLRDIDLILGCMCAHLVEVPLDHRLNVSPEVFSEDFGGMYINYLPQGSKGFDHDKAVHYLAERSKVIPVDSTALILLTSGTSADPKAVMLSHRNLLGNALAKLEMVPQTADDIRLVSLPLSHGYARTSGFGTWLLSGSVLAIGGLGFETWKMLGNHARPTLANTVPSLARRLQNADPIEIGLDRLRLLGCGGAAMHEADFERWKQRGVCVIQGYGLTEASPVICSASPDNARAGYVGNFISGWEHEIRDGKLFVRGPHVMQGYWHDDHATAERIDSDGWLSTGDLVEFDEEHQQLKVLGRADDVLVLDNGYKLHPEAMERELQQLDGVRYAVLVANLNGVALWLDTTDEFQDVLPVVESYFGKRPKWQRPIEINHFDPPLTQESGELTAKRTVCRRYTILRRELNKPKS